MLELQSRYKSDKRFVLDERFIEDYQDEAVPNNETSIQEPVELGTTDEKIKQLNILQDLLGVPIKSTSNKPHNVLVDNKKSKYVYISCIQLDVC